MPANSRLGHADYDVYIASLQDMEAEQAAVQLGNMLHLLCESAE
jgi:hypothetical protein